MAKSGCGADGAYLPFPAALAWCPRRLTRRLYIDLQRVCSAYRPAH